MSKINLNAAEVQVRESRLGSITGFGGSAKELVSSARNKTLEDKNRSFSQCNGCSTMIAACTVSLIQDSVVISHGPVGCSGCLTMFSFTYKVNDGVRRETQSHGNRRIFTTNMEESDTVYGGNAKLAAAIREVYNRLKPNAIFVITTCASGIIGDDVAGIADKAEAELGIPIVPIFCEGFRSKIWTSGFDAGYHGIARKLIKKSKTIQKDLINVINFWGSDVFTRWFKRLGLRPNYLTPYATVKSIGESSQAAATVQICPTLGSYLAAALEQEYGVPEIRVAPPYGIPQTDTWFRALGQLTGKEKEAEAFIKEEKEIWLPELEKVRASLKGKTAYVTTGAAHGHSLLAVLNELGMETVGAAMFHHDPLYDNESESCDILANTVKKHGNIENYNVCNKQEFELVNILNRERPDIMLARHGGLTLWGAKLGIPSLLIEDEHFAMGYEGIVNYGKRILEVIDNDEFVKNLEKHTINPYSKWWINQQNPYYFLGEN